MAAVSAPAPAVNTPAVPSKAAQAQHSEALDKILAVPVVADSLKYAQSTIEAHPLIAQTYHAGENIVHSSLKAAEPLTSRLQPQFAYADKIAVQSLAYAESKWAYPFHATPQELYSAALAPAEHTRALVASYADALHKAYDARIKAPAQSVYDARVAPVYDSAQKQFDELKSQNAYVQRAVETVSHLQANLQKTLEGLSARGKENGEKAQKEAQGISNAIFGELERVRSFALTLPSESRKRFSPVLETFSEAYETLSKEVRNTEIPPTARLQNVLKYVREQSLPALQKAIVHPEQQQKAVPTPTSNGSS